MIFFCLGMVLRIKMNLPAVTTSPGYYCWVLEGLYVHNTMFPKPECLFRGWAHKQWCHHAPLFSILFQTCNLGHWCNVQVLLCTFMTIYFYFDVFVIVWSFRSGKSSIQKVVFHKMSPNETLFLESTNKIVKDGILLLLQVKHWCDIITFWI